MPEVFNPVDVEHQIDLIRNQIATGVTVVSNAEEVAKEKRREFDRAYAKAYLACSDAPAHERKYRANLATMAEREAAEIAETAFKHAERTARSLTDGLGAWQSISKSVLAMYGAVRT